MQRCVIRMTVVHVNQLIFTQITYHQQLAHQIRTIANKGNIRKLNIFPAENIRKLLFSLRLLYILCMFTFRRNRKRRSNRRKTSQNVCNTGFTPVNDVPTNCTFVMNTSTTDTSSPKKRKFSSQDVPGPSSHTKNLNQMPNETPMSEFYHSLLESSYENDFNGKFINYNNLLESPIFSIQIKNGFSFCLFFIFVGSQKSTHRTGND